MSDTIPLDWVRNKFPSAPPAADPPKAQLQVEQLEKRWLFNATALLPRRPAPVEGVAGSSQDRALVQPLTGDLLAQVGLTGGNLAVAGTFTNIEQGNYTFTLHEEGTGPGDTYSFILDQAGSVSFTLTQAGTFANGCYSFTSVVLSQDATVTSTFQEENAHGALTTTSVTDYFSLAGPGSSPYDAFNPLLFDWEGLTGYVSASEGFGLSGSSISSLTLNETGSESLTFQESGTESLTNGTGGSPLPDSFDETARQGLVNAQNQDPLANVLADTGHAGYTITDLAAFQYTQTASDTFSIHEEGSGGGGYSLSCVTFDQSGSDSTTFHETGLQTLTGSGLASSSNLFSGANHSFSTASTESYSFTALNSFTHDENAAGAFGFHEDGVDSSGSFALGSLAYQEQGTVNFATEQTRTQSQSGTDSATTDSSGLDSFGELGTLNQVTGSTESATDDSTQTYTSAEGGTASYTLGDAGQYTNGVFTLSAISSDVTGTGSFTTTRTGLETVSGTAGDSFTTTATDSYAHLSDSASTNDSASGTDFVSFLNTDSYSYNEYGLDSNTRAQESFTQHEAGSFVLNGTFAGCFALGSYLLDEHTLESFAFHETASSLQTDTTFQSGSGNDAGGLTVTDGGSSNTALSTVAFSSASSVTVQSTSTATVDEYGLIDTSWRHLEGSFAGGRFSLGCVVNDRSAQFSVSLSDNSAGTQTSADSVTQTVNTAANDLGTYGFATQSDNGSSLTTSTITGSATALLSTTSSQSGSRSVSLYQAGRYAGYSLSLSSVTADSEGNSSGSFSQAGTVTTASNSVATFTSSGAANDTSNFGGVGQNDSSTRSVSGVDNTADSSSDSYTISGSSTDSFSVHGEGLYAGGSYALVSFVATDNATSSTTQQDGGSDTVTANGNSNTSQSGSGSGASNLGPQTDSSLGSYSDSSSDSYSFTALAQHTSTSSSSASSSQYQAGIYSNFSFALSSITADSQSGSTTSGQESQTQTLTDQGTENFSSSSTGADTFSSGGQNQSGVGSYSTSGSDSFTETSLTSSTLSQSGSDTVTTHQEGVYAGGSYSFGCYVSSEAGTNSSNSQESGSDTVTGSGQDLSTVSNSGSSRGTFGYETNSGSDTVSSSSSDSYNFTNLDTYTLTESSQGSFSVSQAGSFANFSLSLSSFASSSGGYDDTTLNDTSSASVTSSGTTTYSTSQASNDAASSFAGQNSNGFSSSSVSGTTTSQDQALTTTTTTVGTAHDFSQSESGTLNDTSYNLSCISLSDSGTQSFSTNQDSSDTATSLDTSLSTTSSGGSSAGCLGGVSSFSGGGNTGYVASDVTSSTSLSSYSNDSSGTTTFDSSQYGAYANFSLVLSSISSSETLSSTATFNSSSQDSWSSSGTGTTTRSDGTQGTGTLGYNSGITSGSDLATLTDSHSSSGSDSTVYSSTALDDASQSEQGSYAQGSFSLSSFVQNDFQSSSFSEQQGSLSSSLQSQSGTATGTVTLAGTASYLGSNGSGDTTTYSQTQSGTTSDSATASLSETGAQTVSTHQEGTLDPVTGFNLTALSLDQSSSFTFTALNTDNANSSMLAVTSFTENAVGNGAGCFGGASGNQNSASNASGVTTLTDLSTSQGTSSASGSDSVTFHESGSYANFSYSLTSLGYSEGESQTGSQQQSSTDSQSKNSVVTAYTNSSNGLGNVYGQGGFYSGGLAGTGSAGASNSSMTWSTDTISASSSDNATASASNTSGWTLSQQGSYAGGSYVLSSQTYDQQASESFSSADTASGSQTDQGLATSNGNGSQGGNSTSGLFGGQGNAASSTTSSDSFTTASDFSRSSTSSGSDSYTLHQEGVFSNFSMSLGCFLYQAGAQAADSASQTGSSTRTDTVSSLTTASSSDTGTLTSPAALVCLAASGGRTLTTTTSDSHTTTGDESYTQSSSDSQTQGVVAAGSYAGGSYALSLYSQSYAVNESAALTESATATTTGSASAASVLTSTTAGNALVSTLSGTAAPQSGNQWGSASASMTETYNYQATASYSLSQASSDTTVLSQSGDYANFSFALNAVTDSQAAQSSYSLTQGSSENVQGTVVLGGSSAGNQSSSASQQGGMFIASQGQSSTANNSFGGTYSYSALNTQTLSQGSSGSYALYQSGVFAGGLYAFGCFSLDQSASNSVTGSQGLSATAVSAGQGTMSSSNCLTLSTAGARPATNETGLSQSSGSVSVSATWSLSQSLSSFASDEYTSHRAGSFANGDYSLDSVAYDEQALASSTASASSDFSQTSQQVAQTTVSVTDDGSLGSVAGGNSGSLTQSSHSTETTTEDVAASQSYQLSSLQSASWHEEGSYAAGSFALSSAVYTGGGSDSFQSGVSSSDSVTIQGSSDSYSAGSTGSSSTGGQGSGTLTGSGSYSQSNAVSSSNAEDGSDSFSQYQAGIYANGSYALASFSSTSQSSDVTTSAGTVTKSGTASLTFAGSASGNNPDILQAITGAGGSMGGGGSLTDGSGGFSATGNLSNNSSSTTTSSRTMSVTSSVVEAGSYAQGSYALSCFVLDQSSSEVLSASGSSQQSASASGTGSDAFTYTSQASASQSGTSTSSSVLHEEGIWTQADGYSLSSVLSSSSSASSGSGQQSAAATFSGSQESGTTSSAGSFTANSSSTLYQAGIYGAGSYALSSFALTQGDSTQDGSALTWTRAAPNGVSGSYTASQSDTGQDSTYAVGSTVQAVDQFGQSYPTFAFGSYSYSASSAATHTEVAINVGVGYTVTHSLTETDTSGQVQQLVDSQTATSSGWSLSTLVDDVRFDWQGTSSDSLSTTTMSQTLPGGTFTLANAEQLLDANQGGLSLAALPAGAVVSELGTSAAVPGSRNVQATGAVAVLVAGQSASSSPVVGASAVGQRLGLPQPVVLTPQQLGLSASQLMKLLATATQPQALSNPLASKAQAAMQVASQAAAAAAARRQALDARRRMQSDDAIEATNGLLDYLKATGQTLRAGDGPFYGLDGKSNAFQAGAQALNLTVQMALFVKNGVELAALTYLVGPAALNGLRWYLSQFLTKRAVAAAAGGVLFAFGKEAAAVIDDPKRSWSSFDWGKVRNDSLLAVGLAPLFNVPYLGKGLMVGFTGVAGASAFNNLFHYDDKGNWDPKLASAGVDALGFTLGAKDLWKGLKAPLERPAGLPKELPGDLFGSGLDWGPRGLGGGRLGGAPVGPGAGILQPGQPLAPRGGIGAWRLPVEAGIAKMPAGNAPGQPAGGGNRILVPVGSAAGQPPAKAGNAGAEPPGNPSAPAGPPAAPPVPAEGAPVGPGGQPPQPPAKGGNAGPAPKPELVHVDPSKKLSPDQLEAVNTARREAAELKGQKVNVPRAPGSKEPTAGLLSLDGEGIPVISGKGYRIGGKWQPSPAHDPEFLAWLRKNDPTAYEAFTKVSQDHAEGQAAALMWRRWSQYRLMGLTDPVKATFYIDNPEVCPDCLENLPNMLPPGSEITIVTPTQTITVKSSR